MKAIGLSLNDLNLIVNPFQLTGMNRIPVMVQDSDFLAFLNPSIRTLSITLLNAWTTGKRSKVIFTWMLPTFCY